MSAAAVTKAKRSGVVNLQGSRPLPLNVPTTSPPRTSKRPRVVNDDEDDDVVRAPSAARRPVILYEHTPKVIHARPDEFKALVQRLTGRQPTGTMDGGDQVQEAVLRPAPAQTGVPSSPSSSSIQQVQDPLVLTLGQQKVPLQPPFPLDDHHLTLPEMPSRGGDGAVAGFLLSPESFLFSPTTMQAIHELIS